ncbi:unnamed protein product [Pleuronectes platessa]|uniref:Uncharacterized protein n=1 Tax=Pleuronectes platessa TaxID=8262 RepID=A0A9N7U556_PLEPL|nr:unnamed protein product [Pleuronectes platessa]
MKMKMKMMKMKMKMKMMMENNQSIVSIRLPPHQKLSIAPSTRIDRQDDASPSSGSGGARVPQCPLLDTLCSDAVAMTTPTLPSSPARFPFVPAVRSGGVVAFGGINEAQWRKVLARPLSLIKS